VPPGVNPMTVWSGTTILRGGSVEPGFGSIVMSIETWNCAIWLVAKLMLPETES
jgi:hypothetical protein